MSSRDSILSRLRTALSSDAPLEYPPAPEVWPATNASTDAMAQRFTQELEAIGGEVIRSSTLEEAQQRLPRLLDELKCSTVGVLDRPLCRELTPAMGDRVVALDADPPAKAMADLSASLLAPDYLLADTGSAMIACGVARERLLCYLPPVCVIAARTEQLVEHLPAAWEQIGPRVADPSLRGEFVFITGPSRTADIEKILILGVHGPKRLIVLLIG
jgi:L-lactate dehydrogenase complex protein LldG